MVAKSGLLLKEDESQINTWERKVLRRIFGPVNDTGIWRKISIEEFADLYKETYLATVIKTLRLKWLGHASRMEEQRGPKKALEGKPGRRRNRGKPRT
jgi:hypothetical protein